jgi:Flp pilus assembly protein TadB
LLTRKGKLKITTPERFRKLKERGMTSPVVAFIYVSTIILLIVALTNAYLIP